jgi:GPH family glycoside/pentoside/hexuronide:cation symporter
MRDREESPLTMATAATPVRATTSLPTLAAFALPGLPLAAMVLVFGVYLPRFYVGLGAGFLAVAGAIGTVRFIDIWFDPLIGMAMDRTKTPLGRYRPWLLLGAPIAMFGTWKLLNPPADPKVIYLITWMLVTYVGVSILNLSIAAWAAILAKTYDDRSRVYGLTQGLAVVGSVTLLLLPLLTHGRVVLGNAASMSTVCLIIVAAIPVAAIVCAIFTPDRITAQPARARFGLGDFISALANPSLFRIVLADLLLTLGPGTTAPLYVYFFHDAKGFNTKEVGYLLIFYIGAGLLGAPFWGRVAHRFGKHRTVQIACVCYAICQTTLMALPRVWPGHTLMQMAPTAAGMVAVGFCASAFILLMRAMVADVVDEVRLAKGVDLTSLFFSLVTTTTKIGLVITVIIVFPILKMVGYDGKEHAVNTPHAIFGLEMCYLFAPIILVFFGGALFFGYKLDAKRHGAIREALDARDANLSSAAAEEALVGAAIQRP